MNKIIKNSSFQFNSAGDEIDNISSSHNCFCVGTEATRSYMISGATIPHHNLSYLQMIINVKNLAKQEYNTGLFMWFSLLLGS